MGGLLECRVSSARVSLIVHHAVTMSRAALVELPTNMNAGPSPRIVTSKSDQTSESSPSPIPLSACLAAETDPWMSLVEMKPASPSGSSRSSPRASVVQRKSQSVCNPLLLRTLSEHETIPTTMERYASVIYMPKRFSILNLHSEPSCWQPKISASVSY